MNKHIAIIATAALIALTGCTSDEPAEKPVEQVDAQAAETKAPTENNPDYAKESKKIQKKLNAVFDCDWENTNTTKDSIVRIDACYSEELILATGDKSPLKVWAGNMADEFDQGYSVRGDGYALITIDEGTANQAWDALGAEGKVTPLK